MSAPLAKRHFPLFKEQARLKLRKQVRATLYPLHLVEDDGLLASLLPRLRVDIAPAASDRDLSMFKNIDSQV
jgi:hypothetical protein